MKRQEFTTNGWVRITRGLAGIDVGVPRDLPPQMEFDPKLVSALSAADRGIGQLAGITRTLPNPRLLVRSFIGREAVLSSRIEGTLTSLSDLFMFEVNPSVEDRVPDVREVANYVRALDHGMERLAVIPLSLNLIRELHGILLENVRGANRLRGEFRKCQVHIGPRNSSVAEATYVPPPHDQLRPFWPPLNGS